MKILEEKEQLIKKQYIEREATIDVKLRQIDEREKYLKEREAEMKRRHLEQQEILRKKSELLDTIVNNSRSSQSGDSKEKSIASGEKVNNYGKRLSFLS